MSPNRWLVGHPEMILKTEKVHAHRISRSVLVLPTYLRLHAIGPGEGASVLPPALPPVPGVVERLVVPPCFEGVAVVSPIVSSFAISRVLRWLLLSLGADLDSLQLDVQPELSTKAPESRR